MDAQGLAQLVKEMAMGNPRKQRLRSEKEQGKHEPCEAREGL